MSCCCLCYNLNNTGLKGRCWNSSFMSAEYYMCYLGQTVHFRNHFCWFYKVPWISVVLHSKIVNFLKEDAGFYKDIKKDNIY